MGKRKSTTTAEAAEVDQLSETASANTSSTSETDVSAAVSAQNSAAVMKTQPISRDEWGGKNDPRVDDALAGRSELMRRKAQ